MKFSKLSLRLLTPIAANEDVRRREFILNVFAVSISSLLLISIITSGINFFFLADPVSRANGAFSFGLLFAIFLFFVSLVVLSRWGFIKTASYLLLATLFSLASYMGYLWGVDVTASVLFYSLTIVMSGILIDTRFAFLVTGAISIVVGGIVYLQGTGVVEANRYWATQPWRVTDVIFVTVLFLIIATVTWLSNREIEKSLIRARKSEAELKEERDMLEVRVAERTDELRKAELERMANAYRFVEFGRLASGLFHDLGNPLTALSLNIESIADSGDAKEGLAADVGRAKTTMKHMQNLMDSMRKHLSRESVREDFSLQKIIADTIRVLESYARARKVSLRFDADEEAVIHGDPVQLTQVLTNLISNAVESYPVADAASNERTVEIRLSKHDAHMEIAVSDNGSGISAENQSHIFDPFFTTKGSDRGLGIGLSLAKRVVEKEFGGTLTVQSDVAAGSTFVIQFPA